MEGTLDDFRLDYAFAISSSSCIYHSKGERAGQRYNVPKPNGSTPGLSKLCTQCQNIFKGHLDFNDIGSTPSYMLYGNGNARGSLDCHICFMRMRSLASYDIGTIDRLTTRYQIKRGEDTADLFTLVFSYSLAKPPEEFLGSSQDSITNSFGLLPVLNTRESEIWDSDTTPQHILLPDTTIDGKNLSTRYYAPYSIETVDHVIDYRRKEYIIDRGLWGNTNP
ncbi:hypothetical protein F5Y08DRAFT_343373 [Xylaria arbuscula]|nr:hypothetical protein F5Y08DRAFT_343373 [Xylaria arbuscula]